MESSFAPVGFTLQAGKLFPSRHARIAAMRKTKFLESAMIKRYVALTSGLATVATVTLGNPPFIKVLCFLDSLKRAMCLASPRTVNNFC
jgi:hypothetical protein